MASGEETDTGERLELIHPVYIDTGMMVSFVAALNGGVAFEDERTERSAGTRSREREGTGRFGLPLLNSILGLDMSGRFADKKGEESSQETKIVRKHTQASLLNLLRHRLVADGRIISLTEATQLESLAAGDLVEISGEVLGNPLQQIFNVLQQMVSYMGFIDPEGTGQHSQAAESPKANKARGGLQGARKKLELPSELKIVETLQAELEAAAVRDLLLQGPGEIRAVLTLAREFFSDETSDYLLAGQFTALGKVTQVLAEGESINLTRRTALNLAGLDTARGLAEDSANDAFEMVAPVVDPPAIQLLPLAVFV
jgi:hypothetical protein